MTILQQLLEFTADWRPVFPQARSHRRGVRQALGSLVCLGRKTLSRIIWTTGEAQKTWNGWSGR